MTQKKEWTLMFYFASDNPLAPSIVSQLKAIKDAGFHDGANVIARFDPHTDRTPAHIFEVNLVNKLKSGGRPEIGFIHNNSFVRNLATDKLWGEQKGEFGGMQDKIRDRIKASLESNNGNGRQRRGRAVADITYDPPVPPPETETEQSPMESLTGFLEFCKNHYPARRFILFILGHGLVVGNDLFLFDEHTASQGVPASVKVEPQPGANGDGKPRSPQEERKMRSRHSLLLTDLGTVLRGFSKSLDADSEFEMVGFHSCSMSGLEVAYELQNTANYMLASQGSAFVGSWPYRQILVRIFKDLEAGVEIDVKETLRDIFFYCLYNSFDFQLAGYSFDLTLCDLRRIDDIKTPLKNLTQALINALNYKNTDPLAEDLILLSHWDAQSFWLETCTDLRDFCLRLTARCKKAQPGSKEMSDILGKIITAAGEVIGALKKGVIGYDDGFIVRSECAGPAYQYAHGLSIYFPWAEPLGSVFWDQEYNAYQMNKEPREEKEPKLAWRDFLKLYFDQTKRATRADEDAQNGTSPEREPNLDEHILMLLQEIGTQIFNEEGQLGKGGATDATGIKAGATDPTGGDCDCPSIKNYPSTTRALREKEGFGVKISKEHVSGEAGAGAGQVPVSTTFFERIMENESSQS